MLPGASVGTRIATTARSRVCLPQHRLVLPLIYHRPVADGRGDDSQTSQPPALTPRGTGGQRSHELEEQEKGSHPTGGQAAVRLLALPPCRSSALTCQSVVLATRALQEGWLLSWRSKQRTVVGCEAGWCRQGAVARASGAETKGGNGGRGRREGRGEQREGVAWTAVEERSRNAMNDRLRLSLGGDFGWRRQLAVLCVTQGRWVVGGGWAVTGGREDGMSEDE